MNRQVFLICVLFALPVRADWHPVIYNYSQQDYHAGTQNWQIVQSNATGWIYAANNYGLLEYDGLDWRLNGIHGGSGLRSVEIDGQDRVYVGGCDEFGFFRLAAYDEREYVSLSEQVSDRYRPFGEVWSIGVKSNGNVYFQTQRYIFETDTLGHVLNVLQPGSHIYKTLTKGDNLYIATDQGLYLYSCNLIYPLGEWPRGTVVGAMVDFHGQLVVGTDFDGLYVYDKEGLRRYKTEADEFIRKNQLYSMSADGDELAIGTVLSGLVVLDTLGRALHYLDRARGLQNNTILSLCYDRDHNLWVGEDLGIDHASLLWPTEILGIPEPCGVGYTACEHHGLLYLGTNQGLYRVDSRFSPELVGGSAGQVWRLTTWNDCLFCCHNRGLMVVEDRSAHLIDIPDGVWNVLPIDDRYAWACSYRGLYLLTMEDGHVKVAHRVDGYGETMYCAALDAWNNVWAISSQGVVRLVPDSTLRSVRMELVIESTDRNRFSIVRADDQLLVTSEDWIGCATREGSVVTSEEWTERLGGSRKYTRMMKSPVGYITVSPGLVCLNGRVMFDQKDFFVGGFDNATLSEDSSMVIVGGLTGFYRIHLDLATRELPNHPWKEHEVRVVVPWYQTWWARLLSWMAVIGVLILVVVLIRYVLHVHDERLARAREKEIHRQQVRILQLENDKARYELEEKGRRLNAALLGRVNRNEIIAWVQQDVRRITDALQTGDIESAKRMLRQMESKISAGSKRQERDWQNFEESFDSLNPEFVMRLKEKHPDLNEQEVKLCVYIMQGLQTKEIGPLLHLSTRGVEMMRYRMHAKMQLESQMSLKKYILSLGS